MKVTILSPLPFNDSILSLHLAPKQLHGLLLRSFVQRFVFGGGGSLWWFGTPSGEVFELGWSFGLFSKDGGRLQCTQLERLHSAHLLVVFVVGVDSRFVVVLVPVYQEFVVCFAFFIFEKFLFSQFLFRIARLLCGGANDLSRLQFDPFVVGAFGLSLHASLCLDDRLFGELSFHGLEKLSFFHRGGGEGVKIHKVLVVLVVVLLRCVVE